MTVGIRVAEAVKAGVSVGDSGVLVNAGLVVADGVKVIVMEGVSVGVTVAVLVAVNVAEGGIGVFVGLEVAVKVAVFVREAVGVCEAVGVLVGVLVAVGVTVDIEFAVPPPKFSRTALLAPILNRPI